MVRGLGLLILAVLSLGGLWVMALVAWLDHPQFEISFLYVVIPLMAMAAVGMILLWAFTALATLFKVRKTRTD